VRTSIDSQPRHGPASDAAGANGAHPGGSGSRWRKRVGTAKARLRARSRLDGALDAVRFRIDTFPRSGPLQRFTSVGYQPLPWLGLTEARRAEGTVSRWTAIERFLDSRDEPHATALDVGCDNGYFTIQLALRGLTTVGVECLPSPARTAQYAIRQTGLSSAAVLVAEVTPDTVEMLPYADVVLFLSVWHHIVRSDGLEGATALLEGIWRHTRSVLFFDTGEAEMPADWNLPAMEPDAGTWLADYLRATCTGGEPHHLGRHAAFDAAGKPVVRNLFAVARSA
jgi:2-polyprenyl-3-methyl-5-hydroxy-6-metoxy-1,4-benzoquinol methylase